MITKATLVGNHNNTLRLDMDGRSNTFNCLFINTRTITNAYDQGSMEDFVGFLNYFQQAKDAFELEHGKDVTNRIKYLLETNPVLEFILVSSTEKLPFLEIIKRVCSVYGLTYPFTDVPESEDENSEVIVKQVR